MSYPLASVLISGPSSPVISLQRAKAHLRVDHDTDDELIDAQIYAATAYLDGCNGILGRALLTQSWRSDFASFDEPLRLPLAPVQSVAVSYIDVNGASQTLASSNYYLLADDLGPVIQARSGVTMPDVFDRPDAVSVTGVYGYASADAVPEPIKQALLLIIGDFYKSREARIAMGVVDNPTVDRLLAPYRRIPV